MSDGALEAARVLMGDSLGFHIIFVLFGLTLPVLVSWFEWMGIWKRDDKLIDTAFFWSKVMSVLVITGVISGTIIALQMSLVWPGILQFGGEVIGLPFMFETYAFLIEAVFLSLYMSTWHSKRISQKVHAFFGLVVVLGSTASAYAITSVNGWMNLPTGFEIIAGKFENVDVLQAMFSRTALIEFFHSMPGYYLAASLTVAAYYVWRIAREPVRDRNGSRLAHERNMLRKLVLFAAVMFACSAITADITGKYLARYEPAKLAAIELTDATGPNAPLIIGGVPGDDGIVTGPHFKIPNALSILAGNSPDAVVTGLDQFVDDKLPPLYVHTLFDIKMTIITFLSLLFAVTIFVLTNKREWLTKKWLLWPLGISGVLSIAVVELGWMMTEIGRQPWAVRGYVTTQEAVTKTHDITSFGYLFPLSYVALFAVTIIAVRRIIRTQKGV